MFRNELDQNILALALPAVVALAADPLLSLVDTAFVGHLSADALAALGVNTSLFGFTFVVFNFLSTATTPLLAAALAGGDRLRVGQLTLQAAGLAAVLGTALAGGLLWGAESLLVLLGAGPETGRMHDLALVYLQYRAVAAPATLVMTAGQGVFRALSDMRTPLGITAAANAANLALDVALIWGAGLGVAGAAAATSVAEWGAAGAYVVMAWQRREELGLSPWPRVEPRATLSALAPLAVAGGAVLARTVLLLGTKTLAALTATRLGTVPIAAHQVLVQLWTLSSLVVDGLAVSGQTLVATALASGRPALARATADRLLQFGLGLGLALALGFGAAAPLLPGAFSDDGAVAAQVAMLLPLAVGVLPVNALVYVLDGVLTGAADFKFLAGAMAVSAGGTVLLLEVAAQSGAGLEAVWAALAVLMALRLATLWWRYSAPDGPLPPRPPPVPEAPAPTPPPAAGRGPPPKVAQVRRRARGLRWQRRAQVSGAAPVVAPPPASEAVPAQQLLQRGGQRVRWDAGQRCSEEAGGAPR